MYVRTISYTLIYNLLYVNVFYVSSGVVRALVGKSSQTGLTATTSASSSSSSSLIVVELLLLPALAEDAVTPKELIPAIRRTIKMKCGFN